MVSKSLRNMQRSLPNKVEKLCISLAFIIRITMHTLLSIYCAFVGLNDKSQQPLYPLPYWESESKVSCNCSFTVHGNLIFFFDLHLALVFFSSYSLQQVTLIFWHCTNNERSGILTFRHRASSIQGQAFRYSPENAYYIFNQQIYFIILYLLDRASLI